ncbi:L,D-transpeptidase [Thiohalorhabdus sp.]|uniref:L,D-transpeptidase n=1 Tax=Thiohalorhabdus sp. TaxID=3094134 RepID=UPI002FC2C196
MCRRNAPEPSPGEGTPLKYGWAILAFLLIGVSPPNQADGLRVTINLPAYSLRLFDGDELVMERPVTIGAPEHPTPVGRWRVERLIWQPNWMPPPSVSAGRAEPVPPGPDNPMGAVKLPLTGAIYLHGTERRGRLGQPASHGCIRLANEDARALAEHLQRRLLAQADRRRIQRRRQARPDQPVRVRLPEALPVRVRYQPLEMGQGRGVLHPDVYNRIADERSYLRRALARSLGIPAKQLSLTDGELLNRLNGDAEGPLRFDLEID